MYNKDIQKITTSVVEDIKSIINKGRAAAYAAVNTTMIATYWNIGRRIVEEEQHGKERAEYGKNLIDLLAVKLTHEYGSGFSARYLRAFRQLYLVVPNFEIWKSRFPNLLWTHVFRTLRVGDETAIRWYLETASREPSDCIYVCMQYGAPAVPFLKGSKHPVNVCRKAGVCKNGMHDTFNINGQILLTVSVGGGCGSCRWRW